MLRQRIGAGRARATRVLFATRFLRAACDLGDPAGREDLVGHASVSRHCDARRGCARHAQPEGRRADPCPCGSGRRHMGCCLASGE